MKLFLKKDKSPVTPSSLFWASRTVLPKVSREIKKGLTASVIGAEDEQEEAAKEHMTGEEKKEFSRLSDRVKRSYLKKPEKSSFNHSSGFNGKRVRNISGKQTSSAAAGAASGGAASAARAAKRTAEKFRESLEASMAGEHQYVQKLWETGQDKISQGKSSHGSQKGVLLVTGAALLAAAQAAAFLLAAVNMVLIGLLAIIPFLILVGIIASLMALFSASVPEHGYGGARFVEVVRQEEAQAEENIGGQKYKTWYGMDADWCAIFISWCANECGYIEEGIMPRTASVASMRTWYQDQEGYHSKEGYTPVAGDIIFFENNMSHVGVVIEYDEGNRTVTTVEGNSGRSSATPYHAGSRVTQNTYSISYSCISGYASPNYPDAEVIEIPEECGTVYSYMGWQMITEPSSRQYQLREEAGMHFDGNGFGKIGDRYVIACTTTFGQVGDYIDWELENGTIIHSVIGDIKSQSDPGCNEWGHQYGACVIEFVVDRDTWYGRGKYPTQFHPEWSSKVVRAVKAGSYW